MIALNIRKLAEQKKVTLKEIAEYTKITPHGLQKMLNNDDFKTSVLLKIAEFFDVPVDTFFNESKPKSIILKNHSPGQKTKVILQIELDEENGLRMNLGKDLMGFLKK